MEGSENDFPSTITANMTMVETSDEENKIEMSEPMLPVNLCLNLIKVLSSDEIQQVLMTILDLFSDTELMELSNNILCKYMDEKGLDSSFIPKDFSQKLIQGIGKLQEAGVENLLYFMAVWCAARKFSKANKDTTLQNIIEASKGQEFNMQTLKKKPRGRPKNTMKVVVEEKKPEVKSEEENKCDSDIEDGRRKSRRKNKGKNPQRYVDKMKWSGDEEAESDDDWTENKADNDMEKEDTAINEQFDDSMLPAVRRGRPPKAEPNSYQCNICDMEFDKYREYRKHYAEHENEDWPRCKQCQRVHLFKSEELLKEHDKEKHSPLVCDICKKTFTSRYTLIKHGVIHGKTPLFKCPTCSKGFSSRYNLKMHINVYHKGIKPFLCSECGSGFTSKISLIEHTNSHFGLKPFKCEVCGLTFGRKATRRIHMMNEHSDEKGNVKCTVCDRVYRNIYNLNQHMKLHALKQDEKEAPMCDLCGKKFKGKYELEKHKKVVHLKIKEFKCEFCGKAFASRIHLQEHRAVHTREAQFFCEICGEGFIHRVTYKAHVFRHGGTKQCACPLCNKKFDVPRFLVRHIKDVHRGQAVPELPKYKIPKSSIVEHLRSEKNTVKKVDPPAVPVIGKEARRPSAKPTEALQVIEMTLGDQGGVQEMVQILENMEESGQQQQIIVQESLFDKSMVEQAGDETTYVEDGQSRLIELEIDGNREMIHVPASAEYVQVGDKIIALQDILG